MALSTPAASPPLVMPSRKPRLLLQPRLSLQPPRPHAWQHKRGTCRLSFVGHVAVSTPVDIGLNSDNNTTT